MKKLFIVVAVLVLASAAAVQAQDTKLGAHDVMNVGGTERQGCQSCHVPHVAQQEEYIWRWAIPATVGSVTLPATDGATFHTNACMSCHDGATAGTVLDLTGMSEESKVFSDTEGKLNDHPVSALLKQRGTTPPPLSFVRLRKPDGWVAGTNELGYVECGTCHDPHKAESYKFLRAPSGTLADSAFAKLAFCRDCHSTK